MGRRAEGGEETRGESGEELLGGHESDPEGETHEYADKGGACEDPEEDDAGPEEQRELYEAEDGESSQEADQDEAEKGDQGNNGEQQEGSQGEGQEGKPCHGAVRGRAQRIRLLQEVTKERHGVKKYIRRRRRKKCMIMIVIMIVIL